MPLSREDVAEYLKQNWDGIRVATIERFVEELSAMSPEDAIGKMMAGARQYGDFDLAAIPAASEFRAECQDAVVYQAFLDLQADD